MVVVFVIVMSEEAGGVVCERETEGWGGESWCSVCRRYLLACDMCVYCVLGEVL